MKPHFKKIKKFEQTFPYTLINNEWKDKINLPLKTKTGKVKTYNPDYWSPELNSYIEVVTSKPNISEQKLIWKLASKRINLKIFWWQGEDITKNII